MKKKELPEPKLVSKTPLKYSPTMQEAAKRAQYQPKLITISSKVKDFKP